MAEKPRKSSPEQKVTIAAPPRRIPAGPGRGFAGAGNAVVRLGRWFARESSGTWSISYMKWPLLLAGVGAVAMFVGVLSGLPLASLGEHRVKLSDAPLLQTLLPALLSAGFLFFLLGRLQWSALPNFIAALLVGHHVGRMDPALGGWLVYGGWLLTFLAFSVGTWLAGRETTT